MAKTLNIDLFNLIDGTNLALVQHTLTNGAVWTTAPPNPLKANTPSHCKCSGPDTSFSVTLIYSGGGKTYSVKYMYLMGSVSFVRAATPPAKMAVNVTGNDPAFQSGVTISP